MFFKFDPNAALKIFRPRQGSSLSSPRAAPAMRVHHLLWPSEQKAPFLLARKLCRQVATTLVANLESYHLRKRAVLEKPNLIHSPQSSARSV
ncbi:hypothetical protein TNCV_3946811 [Trichonephila clavipes]|nr:hypothetical protein TNCV_3946811 [Trichonephila clavipes]